MPFLAPVIGAIASAVVTVSSFIGSLGFLGQMAIGIGLELAGSALAKKRKGRGQEAAVGGTNLNLSYGGAHGRQIGVGLFATAGQEIFSCAFGAANKIFARVVQLSDFPINGVTRVLIDNEWCSLIGSNNSPQGYNVPGKHSNYIRIKIYLGVEGQLTDAYLVQNSGGQWTNKHKGVGIAYAIIYVTYDQEKMTSIPHFLFEVKGRCYDPRKDSTSGGNGTQRWDNPASWGYSDNPIVQAYNYSRGFYRGSELMMGKGMPASDLPLSRWIPAMNICDEIEGGGKRYRSGMVFHSGDGVQHRDNLEPLMNACAGAIIERVDGDIPLVGITQAVVATLTQDDLIVDASHSYRPKRSRSELVNAVHGTYNDPEKSWEPVSYPAQTSAPALAADGERHAVQIDFKAVFDASQAARLANAALRENRYQRLYTITASPRWIVLEVGDWIKFNHKSYGTHTYRIVARSLTPLGDKGARNVILTLQEVGAGMYDESIIVPEFTSNAPAPAPQLASFPDAFIATPSLVSAQSGARKIPVFDLAWMPTTDVTVTGVRIEYWQTSEPVRKLEALVEGGKTAIRLTGFAPDTAYSFRATYITEPRRTTLWSGVVTAVTGVEEFLVDHEKILGDLAEFNAWISTDLRGFKEREDFANLMDLEAVTARYIATDELKRDLVKSFENSRAEYTELIGVAVDETKSVANRLEKVRVSFGNNLSTAQQLLQSAIQETDGKTTANATSITNLDSELTTLDGKTTAHSSAISSLQTSLTSTNNTVSSHTSSINNLYNEVIFLDEDITAHSSAISGLHTSLNNINNTVSSHTSSLTNLNNSLTTVDGKAIANASAISGLQTSLTSTNNTVSSHTSSLTTLNNSLTTVDGKATANASAISGLQSDVEDIDGQLTVNTTALTNLTAQVAGISSNVTVKSEAYASPGDNWARWGVKVKTGSGNTWSTGSFYIDTKGGSSRMVVEAGSFQITNGSLQSAPFVFENGVLKLQAANIGNVTAGQINILNKFKVSASGEVEIKSGNTLQRLVITNSKIEVYDANNQLRVRFGIW